jgi:hypothetical protein
MPTLRLVATLALLAAVAHAADRPGLRARKPLLPSAPLAHTAPSTDLIAGKAMPEPAAPLTKGYLAVLGGVMIHLVCGSLYCWGNLVTYMPASLKYWSPEGGEGPSDAGLVLAFTLLSQMCGMPFGPLFESLVGPRLTALLGGAMMASGLWLASSATTLTQFVLSYAVLFGLGIGLSYQMPFITGGRWFPGKKGSVQGVVMTGLGSSAFFFNMLCTHLLNPQKVNAVGGAFPPEVYARWPGVLRKLALCYAALALTGAALQSNPSALGKTCTQPRTRAPRNALRRRLRSSPTQIWMLGTSPTSQIWMHVSHVPNLDARLPRPALAPPTSGPPIACKGSPRRSPPSRRPDPRVLQADGAGSAQAVSQATGTRDPAARARRARARQRQQRQQRQQQTSRQRRRRRRRRRAG